MSESMSPYQPPSSSGQLPVEASAHASGVPKVFGILHIVFGSIGMIWMLFSLGMAAFGGKYQEAQIEAYPEEMRDNMREAMQPMLDSQGWTVALNGISLVLAVLMFLAGLKLIKYRRSGLKLSNIYAWGSLLHKVASLVVLVLITAPATKKMMEAVADSGTGTAGIEIGGFMGSAIIVIGVLTVVIMSTYPILTLVFLNKKPAREALGDG